MDAKTTEKKTQNKLNHCTALVILNNLVNCILLLGIQPICFTHLFIGKFTHRELRSIKNMTTIIRNNR